MFRDLFGLGYERRCLKKSVMLTKEASKTVLHVFKDRFLVSRNDRIDNNSYFLDTLLFISEIHICQAGGQRIKFQTAGF